MVANANGVIVPIARGTLMGSVALTCPLITTAAIVMIAVTATVVAASGAVAISNTIFILFTRDVGEFVRYLVDRRVVTVHDLKLGKNSFEGKKDK